MPDSDRAELRKLILDVSFERRKVVLASGRESDFYLDLRTTLMRPRGLRLAGTFLLVLVGWVLFRSATLGDAILYLGRMVGLGAADPAAAVVSGVVASPYSWWTVSLAAAVAWLAPQSWDWTRRLPAWKLGLSLAALWIALGLLATQAYNPFIYFIF